MKWTARCEALMDGARGSSARASSSANPGGRAAATRAAMPAGSWIPTSSRSRYSQRLSTPTGNAGPNETFGFG